MAAEYLAVGTPAPNFEARDQGGNLVRLSNYRGQWVILFFYPKDRTPNCTLQACSFRDNEHLLKGEGAVILGVSRDDMESHEDFARRRRLPFPLLADPEAAIINAYRARGWFGHARRITYVIDPAGVIARVYEQPKSRRHAETILTDLRELKTRLGRRARIRSRTSVRA